MSSSEQQARPPLTNRAMVKEAKFFRKQAAQQRNFWGVGFNLVIVVFAK